MCRKNFERKGFRIQYFVDIVKRGFLELHSFSNMR